MKILIATIPADVHARAVRRGLERLGHDVVLWYTTVFPAIERQSFSISNEQSARLSLRVTNGRAEGPPGKSEEMEMVGVATGRGTRPPEREEAPVPVPDHIVKNEDEREELAAELADFAVEAEEADVVWARRIRLPQVPPQVVPDDRGFVRRELDLFHRASWQALAPDAFWVNPYAAGRRADSKLLQLRIARAVGLDIPPTLASNDPDRIRSFLKAHATSGVIYKPFAVKDWHEPDGSIFGTMTAPLREEDLPADEILQATPNLLQKRIPKAHEVRLTMMGAHPIAVKIDSQAHPDGATDWRRIFPEELPLSPITLPDEVIGKCRTLMRRLGIVFGCIDLIVTPEGEYVFLEVNEMGQWLWVEFRLPEVRMLDAFCRFLVSRDPEFQWRATGEPIRLMDVAEGRRRAMDV